MRLAILMGRMTVVDFDLLDLHIYKAGHVASLVAKAQDGGTDLHRRLCTCTVPAGQHVPAVPKTTHPLSDCHGGFLFLQTRQLFLRLPESALRRFNDLLRLELSLRGSIQRLTVLLFEGNTLGDRLVSCPLVLRLPVLNDGGPG
jgi:hypothetical protein